MKLFNLKETSKETGLSRATIYRFYEKNPLLWEETKIKNKKRLIPESHLNQLIKTDIYSKAIKLQEQNEQLRRLVDLLSNPDTLQYKFYSMNWDYYGGISFKYDYSKKYCYHQMSQAFYSIIKKFGSEIGLRIFFTTEPFLMRDGNHIHFILKVDDKSLRFAILEELKSYFKGNRIFIDIYDKYQAGVYYNSKKGIQGEDWDFLSNKFSKKN